MKQRFRRKTKQKQGLAIKTMLVAGTAAIIVAGTLSSILWQVFRDEPTEAGLPMVIAHIGTFQEEQEIYHGTLRQPVLGIRIDTRGEGLQQVAKNFGFSLAGTSNPIDSLLTNARLYVTREPIFQTTTPVGEAIRTISNAQFEIPVNLALETGSNYIWLTFDIEAGPSKQKQVILADCNHIKIGSLDYEPVASGLMKGIQIQPHQPWYSTRNGDITALSAWNSKRDGSGNSPSSFQQDDQVFFIQAGSVMTNNLNACLPNLVIESNGTLNSTSGLRALKVVVESRAVWNQSGIFQDPASLRNMIVRNGGNYLHMNQGLLPGANRKFEPSSTAWLKSVGTIDSSSVTWGNLVIDPGNTKATVRKKLLEQVRGTLEIKSGAIQLASDDTVIVNKDLILSGGWLIAAANGSRSVIRINRNLIVKDGYLGDKFPAGKQRGNVALYIGYDVLITGGTISFGSTSNIFPGKQGQRPSKWNQTGGTVTTGNIQLMPFTALVIQGKSFGPLTSGSTFNVMHDARLDLGVAEITGEGRFLLNELAILAIGHRDGLNSEGLIGNIQTGKRIFSAGATYIYNASVKVQNTGTFKAVPTGDHVKNLRVMKQDPTAKLVLERNFLVSDTFTLISGQINYNGYGINAAAKAQAYQAPKGSSASR